jgi:curli biogenesis system outer membrane secretion channel CsgG
MRIKITILLVLFLASAVLAELPRISVMNLEDKSGYGNGNVGSGMADMLVTELVNQKKFKVIERSELQKVMNEQEMGQSGLVSAETAAKIGKLLGLQYIITGSVTEFGVQEGGASAFGVGINTSTVSSALDVRVIDVSTAEILSSASGRGSKTTSALNVNNASLLPTDVSMGSTAFNSSAIGQAVREAVQKVAKKIGQDLAGSWKGAIVKVDGSIVIINGGLNVGMKKGDLFSVIRKGEVMKDPETGEELGAESKTIGKIRITEVMDKMSKAQILEGKDIVTGDKVEQSK